MSEDNNNNYNEEILDYDANNNIQNTSVDSDEKKKYVNYSSGPESFGDYSDHPLEENKNEDDKLKKEEQQQEVEEEKESDFNTLDESVCDTLKRDLLRIWHKILHVLLPRFKEDRAKEIKQYDLYGPLLMCIALSLVLYLPSLNGDDKSVDDGDDIEPGTGVIIIFVIIWAGAFVVAINCQFLGASITFCQSVCLLGYCVFPILVAGILIKIPLVWVPKFVKLIIMGVGIAWGSLSSVGFVAAMTTEDKKFLIVYPVMLFYITLSLLIINS